MGLEILRFLGFAVDTPFWSATEAEGERFCSIHSCIKVVYSSSRASGLSRFASKASFSRMKGLLRKASEMAAKLAGRVSWAARDWKKRRDSKGV